MKKPKKENLNNIPTYKCGFKNYDIATGFNEGLEVSEKYYAWDIKTNYIHKDRLSVERIEKIIRKCRKNLVYGDLKTSLEEKDMDYAIATELSNQLKG